MIHTGSDFVIWCWSTIIYFVPSFYCSEICVANIYFSTDKISIFVVYCPEMYPFDGIVLVKLGWPSMITCLVGCSNGAWTVKVLVVISICVHSTIMIFSFSLLIGDPYIGIDNWIIIRTSCPFGILNRFILSVYSFLGSVCSKCWTHLCVCHTNEVLILQSIGI